MNRIEILKSLYFAKVKSYSWESGLNELIELFNTIAVDKKYPTLIEYITKQVTGEGVGELKSRQLSVLGKSIEHSDFRFVKRITKPNRFDQFCEYDFKDSVVFESSLSSLVRMSDLNIGDCIVQYVTDEDHPVEDYIHPVLRENPKRFPFIVEYSGYDVRICKITVGDIFYETCDEFYELVKALPEEGGFLTRMKNRLLLKWYTR